MVWPSSLTERFRKLSTSALDTESRLPVGSSANTSFGLVINARAMATRCCWPPDSSFGRWLRRSLRPSVSTSRRNHCRSGFAPAKVNGMRMFCSAVNIGSRLKLWKMNPMSRRRSNVSWLSFMRVRSSPLNMMCPPVAQSSPANVCINVDLPEPEGPIIAVNFPFSKATLTPRNACTVLFPEP